MHVGVRLRQHRLLLGMNQSKLGAAVASSFQWVPNANKAPTAASRLFEWASAFDVAIS
jgi:hypothetical protein